MAHDGVSPSVNLVAQLGKLDVYRLEQPPAGWGLPVNAYILADGTNWAVIDSGWPGPAGASIWDDCVAKLGLHWSDLKSVWITHAHPDHLGQARHLFERSGCVPAMHPKALMEFLQARRVGSGSGEGEFTALLRRGAMTLDEGVAVPNPFKSYEQIALPPDFLPLRETGVISFGGETLKLILTPGHCHGHLCLWHEPTRTLFAGDIIMAKGFVPIVYMPGASPNPMGDYFDALECLRALRADLFLCGHGEPLLLPDAVLEETIAFHRQQIDRIAQMLSTSAMSAAAIAASLEHRNLIFDKLSNLGKVQILAEVFAYLHYLVAEGKIVVDQHDASGALRYCPAPRYDLSKNESLYINE
jgi:glyoxylase-like metal-dependent hydrolase (beta-lactamase superfamily II)